MSPRPAELVVWRHPCECASASRPLAPGEEPEHRFDVDGDPFPWHITEPPAGFSVVKHGPVYLVKLEVFPIERDSNNEPLDITLSYWRRQPRIGEREFPWAILAGSLEAVQLEGDFPMLRLTMIAEQVDADIPIPDLEIWTARSPQELDLVPRRPPAPGAADVNVIEEGHA